MIISIELETASNKPFHSLNKDVLGLLCSRHCSRCWEKTLSHEVCISLNKQMNKQTNEIHTTADGIKWHGEKLSKAMKGIVGKPEEVGG